MKNGGKGETNVRSSKQGKHFSAFHSADGGFAKAMEKRWRDRRRVYDAAEREREREREGRDARKTTERPELVANFRERERLVAKREPRVWLRSYGCHRRAYIAAMLSANTRVRPIYPKG